jgi:hypothetical protein
MRLVPKQYIFIALICFLAWLSAIALYLSPIALIDEIRTNTAKHIIYLFYFAALILLYRRAAFSGQKRDRIIAMVIAFLFSLFFTIGTELEISLSLGSFVTKFGLFKFFVSIIGYGSLFYAVIILLFDFMGKYDFSQTEPIKRWFSDNRRSFCMVWGVIFLCWLPYLIVFFPGCFSPDSIDEFAQGLGVWTFSAHHTIIHTLLMSAFIRLGDTLGSHNSGAALYSLTQMVIMSSIFSFTLRYLAYRGVCSSVRAFLFVYFALYPVNAFYSITGWKDVIFGGLCLLFFILLVEIFRRPEEMLYSKVRVAMICVVAVLFTLFRNNAVYAVILFTPFLLTALWGYRRAVIPMALVCAVAIYGFNWCAYTIFNVRKPNIVEALAIPCQQIARTVLVHGDKLTQSEINEISRFFHVEELPRLYDPTVFDPVKSHGFKASAFREDMIGFFNIWAQFGLKFPGTYITSFLCNSYGYWYPDVDSGIYGTDVAILDYLSTSVKVRSAHLFPKMEVIVKNAINFLVRKSPAVSMLGSIGFMVWVIIFSVGIIISRRGKNMLVPILLPGFVWFTTLASPAHAEYRYVYGVILCAPVIFILSNLEVKFNG